MASLWKALRQPACQDHLLQLKQLTTVVPMPDLSPAAQAVLNAATASAIQNLHGTYERDIAAALRAAADQVVPHSEVMPQQDLESRREAMVWGMVNQTQVTRQQLLAIAAELEGNIKSGED